MLKNPGLKIQVIAKIYFAFFVIAGIIAAALFIIPGSVTHFEKLNQFPQWQHIVIGLGCLVGSIILGFLSCLPFYAFGTLVQDTAENKATLLRLEEMANSMNAGNAPKAAANSTRSSSRE